MNSLSVNPCTKCGAVPEWSPAFVESRTAEQPYVCADCESARQPWGGMVTEAPEGDDAARWLAAEVPY